MAGDFIGCRRSDSNGTTGQLQAKRPRWHSCLVPICISLLVVYGIVFVLISQTASADNASARATSAVDNRSDEHEQGEHKRGERNQGERDDGRPSVPRPEPVVQLPEAQKPGPNTALPSPEEQKSKPDIVAPPAAAQTSKPETETIVRQPEGQKSSREATDFAAPQLVLPADVAKKVGRKIWLNETNGDRDAITSWNANEEFPSLGIGHFIWFPAGKAARFEEDFPPMLEFLRKRGAQLPSWLDKTPIPPCPWMNRADFMKKFNSPETKQLRQFLLDTFAGQTQFLVARAQGAMDKILENTPDNAEREHIITQFSRIALASKDLYPLIDYIDFKGEGTNPAETAVDKQTGNRQGWGLKQVLLRMSGTTGDQKTVLEEFADAAHFVLRQRVHNIPADRISEPGWLRRVETYRRPIADLESNPTGESQEQQGEQLATPTDHADGNHEGGPQPQADTAPKGPTDHGLRSSFKIQLTYSEKLLVPRGSNVAVTITDAKGHKVTQLNSSTKQDAPPYLIEIPIKKTLAYPLTLDAELVSRIGHRFSERTTIDESSVQADAPIEIHLQKK